jgi:hypothetical protein
VSRVPLLSQLLDALRVSSGDAILVDPDASQVLQLFDQSRERPVPGRAGRPTNPC